MLLILQRPAERESALRQFLQDAHAPGNPSFHQWLKPEQFGALYGPNDADIAAVTSWLQSHGFSVKRITKGKTAIEFSGTAGKLRQAFHTEIHAYLINNTTHHANNNDPQIPAALAPVIAGITPINDFQPTAYSRYLGKASYDASTHTIKPDWTFSSSPVLALAPGDFNVQYDVNPILNSGVTGRGVIIGIIGASNIDPAVVATYRTFFGLPANTFNVVLDGSDPGENGAFLESYLDVEVSGSVAPAATINLYTAASTSAQSGLLLAAQRAVDDDVAPVLSTSYGLCEQTIGAAGNQFWASLWEQAAAQGQTSFVSAGDSGSAVCDDFNLPQAARKGLAVSGFASTPWNVAVGGTDFYYTSYAKDTATQTAELGTYWNLTPSTLPTTSLLKPVPEQPWNFPFGLNTTTKGVFNSSFPFIVAGSGGASSCSSGVAAPDGTFSSCTSGYAKPAWQSGRGVPADGVRDLPDLSLFAADGENFSFYPICAGPEECVEVDGNLFFSGVGGTSASSPAMAGIMALIVQKYGAQGQANFVFYPLAAQHPTAFHDVTVGSNVVPCQAGSPSCAVSTVNDNTHGFNTLGHYYATAGYDQATGLGSVDANLLLQFWNSVTFKPTTATLNLSQTTFTHGSPINVSVAVTGNGGTPSGDVSLLTTATPTSNVGLGDLTLQNGAASTTLKNLPGGQYNVTAHYGGDTLFAPSTSAPVAVNVAPESSKVDLSGSILNFSNDSFDPITNGGSYSYGDFIAIDAQPHGAGAPAGSSNGVATGTVTFTDAASSGAASSSAVNIDRKGLAEWVPTIGFPVGTHSISASYSGDSSFSASSSTTPVTFTITKSTPTVNLFANPPKVGLGQPETITADAAISDVAPPPTGTITFFYGNTTLGTATLSPSRFSRNVGEATLTVTTLPLGTDVITATYSGDSNLNTATATPTNVVVEQPANLTASASSPTVSVASSFTVTATVATVSGQPVPTGVVTFDGSGNFVSVFNAATLVNGTATVTFSGSEFNIGGITMSVFYLGDSVYAPGGASFPMTITPAFSVGATPLTIPAGATTGNSSTVTVTPLGGFTGPAFLSCELTTHPQGAIDLPSCAIPASVNVTNGNPVTAGMTVNSTAPTRTMGLLNPPSNWTNKFTLSNALAFSNANSSSGNTRVLLLCAAMVVLAIFLLIIPALRRTWGYAFSFLIVIPAHRRIWHYAISFLILLAGLCALAGCGGGSTGGGPHSVPGTTPGTYTFTVTASVTNTPGATPPQTTVVTVTIQ
jgi:hypothetical protein